MTAHAIYLLEDAVSPQIMNNRDQVQSHTNDEYGNAEQDPPSETPDTEPMPEIKDDTQQPDDDAANGRSQQTWVGSLFW
jgi:hypothetical protein